MKRLKSTAIATVCLLLATFTASSCLDTENSNYGGFEMSKADSISAVSKALGQYRGKMYYYDPAKKNDATYKGDSIDMGWKISNYLLTKGEISITDFPVSKLAVYINNSHSMDKSKEILNAAQPLSFTTDLKPYGKASSAVATLYLYTIAPKTKELTFNVNYENNTHSVKLVFAEMIGVSNNYYYYPVAQILNSQFQGNILIDKVIIDGTEHKIVSVFGIKGKNQTPGTEN